MNDTIDYSEVIKASRKLSLNGTIRTILDVSYEDKDEVRSKGGKWDAGIKKWYFRGDRAHIFAKWLPSLDSMKSRLDHLTKFNG